MQKVVQKQSKLVQQVEKLFPEQQQPVSYSPEPFPYAGELRIVQSVTTYSACEEPIPNPYR
jgi:hypothetical protein